MLFMKHYSTGMCITGASPKYLENSSAFIVALISTRRRSGRLGRRSRSIMMRKSSFMPRSWISSTSKWLTPINSGSWTCNLYTVCSKFKPKKTKMKAYKKTIRWRRSLVLQFPQESLYYRFLSCVHVTYLEPNYQCYYNKKQQSLSTTHTVLE